MGDLSLFRDRLTLVWQALAGRYRAKQSERRLRAFVAATSDVVYCMSPDWSVMYQLQGKHFIADTQNPERDWLQKYIHPDDQARVMAVIGAAIRTRTTFELEHRVRRVDGSLGWTFSRAIPLMNAAGEITEWFGAASDITTRKEAEAKLQAQLGRLDLLGQITHAIGEHQDAQSIYQVVIRTLEDQLPLDLCCVCLYDPADQTLTVTSVGVRSAPLAMELAMTERSRIETDSSGLSDCVAGQLVYEPDIQAVRHPFARRLAGGGLAALVAAPLIIKDQVFGILIAARRVPESFSSGECEFIRQLSEHVALAAHQARLYGALQSAYDDLRRTQQAVMQQERLLALGQMASGIAHDINNAISPISIYTDLMLRAADLPAEARGQLAIIQRAIDDVAQTVGRMREFYRTRESQQDLKPVDLNAVVLHAIELTRARWSDMAHQRGVVIDVRTELQPQLPLIAGTESELRDVLTNLILNALDAMPTGGELRVRTRASHGKLVELEVTDTGGGMDEETRRRCLEPFFTTKGERGTGLGLAMVYGAVRRHGAELDIRSAVGRGTTMTLTFNITTAEAAAEADGADTAQTVPPQRVLLVDDDPLVLESMRSRMEADGHHVTIADGGQAGIDAFATAHQAGEPFQVVITDLGMPHVDGRQVSRAVKSAVADTLVIMLTGWGQRLAEDGELPAHVDCVLGKPPKLRELRETMARYLRAPN